MENFELIEKYILNQLDEVDKNAFEQQLKTDPSLKNELALQESIVNSIKTARAVQLKTMLSQVPVSAGFISGVAATKIIAAVFATSAVIVTTYNYFNTRKDQTTIISNKIEREPAVVQQEVQKIEPATVSPTKESKSKPALVETEKQAPHTTVGVKNRNRNKASRIKGIQKIEAIDPSTELSHTGKATETTTDHVKSDLNASRITVETINSNKDYSFHYQFQEGKLILYGSFDKDLYEILELHGDSHTVFLFYKENYYLLNPMQTSIVSLSAIKDALLIKKLKQYQSNAH